jgi:hypothetical protein
MTPDIIGAVGLLGLAFMVFGVCLLITFWPRKY